MYTLYTYDMCVYSMYMQSLPRAKLITIKDIIIMITIVTVAILMLPYYPHYHYGHFPGDCLWAWEFHPLRLRFHLSRALPKVPKARAAAELRRYYHHCSYIITNIIIIITTTTNIVIIAIMTSSSSTVIVIMGYVYIDYYQLLNQY